MGDGQSLLVALALSGAPYTLPYGEGLARANEQPVDMADGQREVGSLVLLQLHVDIAQSTANEGVVAIDEYGQRCLCTLLGEGRIPEEVPEVTLQNFLLRREAIGKW